MRKLTKIQSIVMALGAVLMVVGVIVNVLGVGNILPSALNFASAISYMIGTVLFAGMQFVQVYEGQDLTVRRLRNIQVIGAIALILSGLLMVEQTFRIIMPLVATSIEGYNTYYHYVHNNWGVLLLISCILELYTTLRLANILNKEA